MPRGEDQRSVANLGDVSQAFENTVPGWVAVPDLAGGIAGAGEGPVSAHAAGTILRQMPGEASTGGAALASSATDPDYDMVIGLIVVPIVAEGGLVAMSWVF